MCLTPHSAKHLSNPNVHSIDAMLVSQKPILAKGRQPVINMKVSEQLNLKTNYE